jgi:hypothetical protein
VWFSLVKHRSYSKSAAVSAFESLSHAAAAFIAASIAAYSSERAWALFFSEGSFAASAADAFAVIAVELAKSLAALRASFYLAALSRSSFLSASHLANPVALSLSISALS